MSASSSRVTSTNINQDLILQTKDGSQCVTWSDSCLTYLGRDCNEIPVVLIKVYGKHARRVDFSYCRLTCLRGLDSFTRITEVILDNNALDDSVSFPSIQLMTALSINKNNFTNLSILLNKISTSYPKLSFLSLIGNPCCPSLNGDGEDSEYRMTVMSRLPRLEFLDSTRVKKTEKRRMSLEKKILPYVVRPSLDQIMTEDDEEDADGVQVIEPAVPAMMQASSTSTTSTANYGKVRYRYTGKHSEGNRFIKNNQL
jgi:hypothetical protein